MKSISALSLFSILTKISSVNAIKWYLTSSSCTGNPAIRNVKVTVRILFVSYNAQYGNVQSQSMYSTQPASLLLISISVTALKEAADWAIWLGYRLQ